MLFSSTRLVRLAPVLFALVAALMFAPTAFARGNNNGNGNHGNNGSYNNGSRNNWGVSLGFAGPGYSIGYSDCRNCGGGNVSASFYGGYGYGGYGVSYGGYGNYNGGYGGAYYAPGRYPVHYPSYGPSYGPRYGAGYYGYSSYRGYPPAVRPVARRVVYYDNYYYERSREVSQYREERYPNADRYVNDRGYSRRAAYYDRD